MPVVMEITNVDLVTEATAKALSHIDKTFKTVEIIVKVRINTETTITIGAPAKAQIHVITITQITITITIEVREAIAPITETIPMGVGDRTEIMPDKEMINIVRVASANITRRATGEIQMREDVTTKRTATSSKLSVETVFSLKQPNT